MGLSLWFHLGHVMENICKGGKYVRKELKARAGLRLKPGLRLGV